MSTTAPVTAQSSTATAMTSTKPEVVWQARIWAFLTDKELRVVPCVSSKFQFCLPILKMKSAMDRALYHQSLAYQALQLAKMALDWDFSFQGASANQSPTEFHNKDPLSKAIECSSTTYDLIADAIASIKAKHMKDKAAVNRPTSSSSTSVDLLEEEPTLAEKEEEFISTPEQAMVLAFDHQTRSCQFQELATEALEEMIRINLYVDFQVQGASKSQPLPSILTAQRPEPIFLSPYQIDEDYYAQPNKEDDPVDEAFKSSCTAYKFIELATAWIHGETQEAEGDEGEIDDSSTRELQAGPTRADQPYCSEEDEDDVDEGAGNLKPNPNRTALNLGIYSVEPKTPDLHLHLQPPETPDSVARCLQFTPNSQDTSTPVPAYPEPRELSPYPVWNLQPPSDPRWKALIMQSQESSPIPHEPLTPPVKFTLSSPSAQESNPEDETF